MAWAGTDSAIKIVSPHIAHKSDVGGVLLGIDANHIHDATEQMLETVESRIPDAKLDGVLVSPMREPATELIVGVTRDKDWGLMLAVGMGGILVEVLNDVALSPLPVDKNAVIDMLKKLRGKQLLEGVRGAAPADTERLAAIVSRIANVAAAMGDRLETAEINPLRVEGSQIEALDALVVLREDSR